MTRLRKRSGAVKRKTKSGRRVTAPRKTYRSARKHTRKVATKKRSRQWEHVYETARKEGFREGDAIRIANGVIKKTRLRQGSAVASRARKNPLRRKRAAKRTFGKRGTYFILEGIEKRDKTGVRFWFWDKQHFTDNRGHAEKFISRNVAYAEAKRIRYRLPTGMFVLRVVPA